jgi:hypothetical protein
MNQTPPVKKTLFLAALGLLLSAGCVSIYDTKVQVQRPGEVESYNNRSPLDHCTPHVYPHRLIQATTGIGYPYLQGGALINQQDQFDQYWAGLSVQLNQDKVVSDNLKPVIDWNTQTVYLIPFALNPGERIKPFGDEMTTDCYTITIQLYRWLDKENDLKVASAIPVYIYIYPKALNQPVGIEWHYPTPTPTFTVVVKPTATPTATPTPEEDE